VGTPPEGPRIERRRPGIRPLPSHRQWTPLGRGLSVMGDNWTLAIVTELAAGRTRLSELRERLAGVSAGVLDRYLHRMVGSGLVERLRFREMPPRVELELTAAGRDLLPIAEEIGRWGLRWAWSTPEESEIVDPGALLRTLPSLLTGRLRAPDGAVELILDQRGGTRRQVAVISDGEVAMWADDAKQVPPPITATIRSDWRGWTSALGPEADLTELEISGRRTQALRLLAALARPAPAGDGAQPRAASQLADGL
jgi:DNA-binding HxlR family transcriptional regulator